MTQAQAVLAECLDLWLSGGDPSLVLKRHPALALEVASLLATAQRVRDSAAAFYAEPDTGRLRARSNQMIDRRHEANRTLLRRLLTVEVVGH